MNIFQFQNYRDVLRSSIEHHKKRSARGFTFAKMAKACRVQRTWLSAVLNGRGHMSNDQLFMACRYLEFDAHEIEFVDLLHQMERSAFTEHREVLDRRIADMRRRALTAETYVATERLPAENKTDMTEFYLDFNAQLVHMFLTIKRFRRDIGQIRRILEMDAERFERSLGVIERAGLISCHGKTVTMLRDSFHLPVTSPLYPTYCAQMRLKAVDQLLNRAKDTNYGFSVLFSAPKAAREEILARFFEYIEWCKGRTQSDEPTEVMQMNFDLLKWGE